MCMDQWTSTLSFYIILYHFISASADLSTPFYLLFCTPFFLLDQLLDFFYPCEMLLIINHYWLIIISLSLWCFWLTLRIVGIWLFSLMNSILHIVTHRRISLIHRTSRFRSQCRVAHGEIVVRIKFYLWTKILPGNWLKRTSLSNWIWLNF